MRLPVALGVNLVAMGWDTAPGGPRGPLGVHEAHGVHRRGQGPRWPWGTIWWPWDSWGPQKRMVTQVAMGDPMVATG